MDVGSALTQGWEQPIPVDYCDAYKVSRNQATDKLCKAREKCYYRHFERIKKYPKMLGKPKIKS